MSEKIMPCPFCGSENLGIRVNPVEKSWNAMSAVACKDCYAQGPTVPGDDAAIKSWNRMPRVLRWTKEPPAKPGWYWRHVPPAFGIVIEYVDPEKWEGVPIGAWWAGPVPEPEEER